MSTSRTNWLLLPPAPPTRFWLEGAPADFIALQDKLDHGEPWTKDELIYYHAERGRRDLFFLGKHILGFDRLQEDLHAPLAWACQAPNGTRLHYPDGTVKRLGQFRMAEFPRGTLKTTLWTVAYSIYIIINDPNARILIYSSSAHMAQKPFSQIRARLEGKGPNGDLFKACYGALIPGRAEREKWSDSMLTVKRPVPYSDATVEASGIGAAINGSHFTHQQVDDIVSRRETREQMEKICESLDALDPLYDSLQTGERRFVCTPWAFFGPDMYVERNWPEALVARRCLFERNGEPLTDEREFSEDALIYRFQPDMSQVVVAARRMKRRNPYFYACQYECNPRDERRIGFRKEWIRHCIRRADLLIELDQDGREKRQVPLARCNVYVLVDPNTGRVPGERVDANKPVQASVDYVGIVVLAVAPDNIWYVVEAYRERYSPHEFVNKVFELTAYWSPRCVAIEQRSAQRWIRTVFQGEWRRGRPLFQLRDWDGAPIAKPERIRGLIPRVAEGFIYFRTQANEQVQAGVDDLISELLDFPNAENDDASDALSAGLQIAMPPGKDSPLTRVEAISDFERDMAKLDPTSQRVWRALRKQEQAAEGFSFGSDFWQ